MKNIFPLFQSHLDLAHHYWSQIIQIGDTVIDATCGNGYDTLKLCQLTLANNKGHVHALDYQAKAIDSTRSYLSIHLSFEQFLHISFHQRCHSTFPDSLGASCAKLIVYNLGYLPGANNKFVTTKTSTTIQSLQNAQILLQRGGAISITCYPGHEEGLREQESLLAFVSTLSPKEWSCCHHVWLNRQKAPSLLIIQKNC